ncbi:unnamed protein product [Rangifer tarandus platyrhynchus]|uniref:Uncharacterized protein n=2 Tax=Rangifer tarandus platyrhynchus TaxID=3082113 RepID=A0ABN8ZWR7_RANTA|nr:unnamed protein product [Rangifer tarandus platyrhynchus]CAI9711195.1 unnamed protein product [Rangifer tarandus platyrhynchus]
MEADTQRHRPLALGSKGGNQLLHTQTHTLPGNAGLLTEAWVLCAARPCPPDAGFMALCTLGCGTLSCRRGDRAPRRHFRVQQAAPAFGRSETWAGSRRVTSAEGRRAVLPQLPTRAFAPPPHPRTPRASWLAGRGDPALAAGQVPRLPERTEPAPRTALHSARCIYSRRTGVSSSGSYRPGPSREGGSRGRAPGGRAAGTSLSAQAAPPPENLTRARLPPGTKAPPVPGCRSAVRLRREKNKHLACRF